jgi:uncharacterized damage-inducible protein DinB
MATEVWMTGPVPGYEPLLMPVVHSLLQVRAEVDALLADLTHEQVWTRPAGAASVGFHVQHLAGSTERLLTYARGEQLTPDQLATGQREGEEPLATEQLLAQVHDTVERALAQVRATSVASLLEARAVGRARLPSTTLGLLFHLAEHATRHAGQALTTSRVVRAAAR